MKATISKDGTLTVSGETELEEFALTKWHQGWPSESTLLIEVSHPHTPGARGTMTVDSVACTVEEPTKN